MKSAEAIKMAITSFQRSEMKFTLNRSQFQMLLSKIEKYM